MEMAKQGIGAGWVIFGSNGTGKTTSVAHLLDGGVVIQFKADAHRVMETVYGIRPSTVHVVTQLEAALKILKAIPKGTPAVLIDDVHYMIESYAEQGANFWKRISNTLYAISEVTDQLAAKGVLVFITANMQPPRVSSGKDVRGGPMLPGQMPEKFCGLFHAVARTVSSDEGMRYPGWDYWLDFGSDPAFMGKNRDLALSVKRYPPFVAEILRAGGLSFDVPTVDSHSKVVQKIADTVQGNYEDLDEVNDYVRSTFTQLAKAKNIHTARTLVMAGLTRGSLQYAQFIL